LIPPGDDKALAAAISLVLTNPRVAASMRPRARAMAEEHVSPTVVAAKLRKCFSSRGSRNG
jgi:glycosyltransferase involved in cell wall biosynthesis